MELHGLKEQFMLKINRMREIWPVCSWLCKFVSVQVEHVVTLSAYFVALPV